MRTEVRGDFNITRHHHETEYTALAMKIKRLQNSLKLPPYGQILGVSVKALIGGEERWHMVNLCYMDTIRQLSTKNPDMLGMPTVACVAGNRLEFWPAADRGMELRIRYYPPEMEA